MKFTKTTLTLMALGILGAVTYLSMAPQEHKQHGLKKQIQLQDKKTSESDPTPRATAPSQERQKKESTFKLQQAIESGNHTPILERIDRGQLDVDHRNKAGMTLLMQALDYDQPKFAYALLERGADVLATDQSGTKVLTQALLLGETEIVKQALKKGADPNTELDLIGSALLMYAAQEGLNKEVELLIEHGAHVNHQNQRGETALMWASDMGQYEMAKLLLEHKANPNLKNQEDLSARDMALKRGLKDLAQLLGP